MPHQGTLFCTVTIIALFNMASCLREQAGLVEYFYRRMELLSVINPVLSPFTQLPSECDSSNGPLCDEPLFQTQLDLSLHPQLGADFTYELTWIQQRRNNARLYTDVNVQMTTPNYMSVHNYVSNILLEAYQTQNFISSAKAHLLFSKARPVTNDIEDNAAKELYKKMQLLIDSSFEKYRSEQMNSS